MAIQNPLPASGIEVIVVTSIFLLLAILAVVARFYARSIQKMSFWLDDYLIVAGLVFTIATVAVGYLLVLYGGVGLHVTEARPEQLAMTLKLFVPAPLLWASATSLIKLSILFFYIRIFTMPRLRTAAYVVIALLIFLIIAVILRTFLLCRPFAFTWDKTIQGGVCGNTIHAYLAIAVVNLVIDLFVVVLPMPILWTLQMALGKKIAVSSVLGLGLLICGLTAARIHTVLALDPLDFTYTVPPDLILGALEIELGIVSACLPTLRPVYHIGSQSAFIKSLTSSTSALLRSWSRKASFRSPGNVSKERTDYEVANDSFERLREGDDSYTCSLKEGALKAGPHSIFSGNNSDSFCDLEQGKWNPHEIVIVRQDVNVHRS